MKTYSEMITLPTFEERLNYLRMNGIVGSDTFGFDRILNQQFYKSKEWKKLRDQIIIRDNGCDLGIEDHPIFDKIIIHHMNPLRQEDITNQTDILLNPDYLVCVSHITHNAIHYGCEPKRVEYISREINDTTPWKS